MLLSEATKIEQQVEKYFSRRKKCEQHNELSLVSRKPTE
jgi:hypothetical protein